MHRPIRAHGARKRIRSWTASRNSHAVSAASRSTLKRLTAEQRASFIKLWDKLPPHLRDIKFDLHGEGWTPVVIDQLGTVLSDYQDMFRRRLQT